MQHRDENNLKAFLRWQFDQIWQIFQSRAIFECLLPIWENFGLALTNFVCHGESFH